MSIGTTPRKAGPYPGNGVAAAFPFGFKVFAPADVLVVRAVVATGAEATLVLGTHYTVALNSDQKTSPGGTVTLIGGPLAADFTLTIGSAVPATQPAEFTNLGRFYPRVLNDSLDRLTILVQQLAEQVGRSLKIGFSSAAEASPDALLAALGSASSAASAAATTATGAADTAVAAAASATNRVSKTGDTMTGPLTLPGNASQPLQAVPKQQAESIAAASRSTLASLTVTVNANAMTATLAAETLDFRSTTLSSGTPVSRTALAAASLTVPSAATLGTVSGQAARIVWGWLDNAGTLEPFVANLAGGVNLDETTLISTTAISGTANSAGVIYSQTARNNVAFRVRGFCDVTQATAGTWATAPTLVQGTGGQALAAMSSLGYAQRWQDMSASRAFGTTYYNTTGRPIAVSVSILSVPATAQCSLSIGGVAASVFGMGATAGLTTAPLYGIVPPGAAYSVANAGGALGQWVELR